MQECLARAVVSSSRSAIIGPSPKARGNPGGRPQSNYAEGATGSLSASADTTEVSGDDRSMTRNNRVLGIMPQVMDAGTSVAGRRSQSDRAREPQKGRHDRGIRGRCAGIGDE